MAEQVMKSHNKNWKKNIALKGKGIIINSMEKTLSIIDTKLKSVEISFNKSVEISFSKTTSKARVA